MIQVVNKYKHDATSDDVYIGRGSLFGNPFSHLPSAYPDIIKCDTREDAIDSYREYFQDIMDGCGCSNKEMKNKLRDIIIKLKLGGDVNLVCYCKPCACHGDVLMEYILKEV